MYKRGTSNIGNFSLQEWEDRYALTEPLPPLAIPATLHDSLMARLDRLATVKVLAQLGATLGREFSYALLRAVSPWDEETLQQGLQQLVEAEFLYLARELAHPHSLAFTLDLAAWLHQFRREGQVAQERAEAAVSLETDQGFALWVAAGTIWRGWALAEQGQVEAGISQMRQGLDAWRATGAVVWQPHVLALLADAYGKSGRTEEGLLVLAEAASVVEKTGEHLSDAELSRLKGELLFQSGAQAPESNVSPGYTPPPIRHVEEAEACFCHALDTACLQQAKSLELRAATSLARLWQSQGKHQDAYDLLAPVYEWFTEGFDTVKTVSRPLATAHSEWHTRSSRHLSRSPRTHPGHVAVESNGV